MSLNHHAVHHVIKRGLDFAPCAREKLTKHFASQDGLTKLSTGEILSLTIAPLCFYLAYLLVQYTLFQVLPGLVNIEQPTTVVVSAQSIDADADADSPLEKAPLLDEEVVVIRQEPITSSIRGAMRYLRTIGGSRAQYRGFWISTIYHITHVLMVHGLLALSTAVSPIAQPAMTFVCHMAATVVLSRLHMTWTHVVVSPPSQLPWYKRSIHGRYVFKALLFPSFKVATAQQLVVILPAITFFVWGPVPDNDTMAMRNDLVLRGLAVVATAALVAFFVLLPASVHLTRVEASLLPNEVDTVVAFDRTLGGRVDNDTKWSVRYLAVITSFTGPDRRRIAKYYIKATATLMVIAAFSVAFVAMQVNAIGVDRIRATVKDMVDQAQRQRQG